MLSIRCVLAEHAESNCCLLQLVICFLRLLSLLPNIPPSKVNGFWEEKPERRCPQSCTVVNWMAQSVPVSLGLGAGPFLGWDLDMGLP